MQQTRFHFGSRAPSSTLLSLTLPSKELFQRHFALSRKSRSTVFPFRAENGVKRRFGQEDQETSSRARTFFMRVTGDSMCGIGIHNGDLLAVDRSVPATHGCVVIAVLDGELTIKQLFHTPEGRVLRAAHPDHPDVPLHSDRDFSVWGVVQWNIHRT